MTHQQAKAELDRGTPAELICATCPWDRLCVEPPKMSQLDYQRTLDEAEAKDKARDPQQTGLPAGMLLTALTMSPYVDSGRLCPVFALRLGGPDGRQLADSIRQTMRTWSES